MTQSIVDRTIGFPLGGIKDVERAFTEPLGSEIYSYARRENPTVVNCEKAIAKIEKAKWCLLSTSGMSASNLALSIFSDQNDKRPWIFPDDIYSGTKSYAINILQNQRGTNIKIAEPVGEKSTTENLIIAIEEEQAALVFIEPISNPILDIIDVDAVITAAQKSGARVIVDNTFATAHLYRPLEMGADIVVHSATKYLGGHNNILAGVICVNDGDLYARLITQRNHIGAVLSPDDAGRLNTQSQTFAIRVARQNENAMQVAQYLNQHPGVAVVRYPGLQTHAGHDLAKQMFNGLGFGAMITFDVARDEEGSSHFVDGLSPLIPHIGSLGDVTTSFLHVEACFMEGFSQSTIRLSVGVEPVDQIISNLEKALSSS